MKNSFVRGIIVLTAVAGLAACGGGNSSSGSSGGGGPTCALPTSFVAVYPINNSSNVPANTGYLFIATTATNIANSSYNLYVQPPNGLPFYYSPAFSQVPLSQVPNPHTKPSFSGALYYKALIANYNNGLISGAQYQVGFNNGGTNCTPPLIDTFTTI